MTEPADVIAGARVLVTGAPSGIGAEGNDPPFGPPSGMEPQAVTDALVAQLRSGVYEAFACDEDAAIAAAKRRDPNGFFAATTPSGPHRGTR